MRRFACTLLAVLACAGCESRPGSTPLSPEVEEVGPPGPELNVRVEIPEDSPGPPFYSLLQPGWFPMTDEWAAVFFIRETDCVPGNFNLIDLVDLVPAFPNGPPRPFVCPLTIRGHEIWNTDPPDPAVGPLNITAKGVGAVPFYFVAASEAQAAAGDGILTIDDLEAMGSLLVGWADRFTLAQQTGTARGRPGSGKINVSARGQLADGRTFFFQTAEGPPFEDPIAHTRIEFR